MHKIIPICFYIEFPKKPSVETTLKWQCDTCNLKVECAICDIFKSKQNETKIRVNDISVQQFSAEMSCLALLLLARVTENTIKDNETIWQERGKCCLLLLYFFFTKNSKNQISGYRRSNLRKCCGILITLFYYITVIQVSNLFKNTKQNRFSVDSGTVQRDPC